MAAAKNKLPPFSELVGEHSTRRAERSLRFYFQQAWHILEPQTTFVPGWHIDCICEHLEAVTAGEIKRLSVHVPPRMTKSLLVSVAWPTWEWIQKPEQRWMFVSYSADLSTMHSTFRRNLIESLWYRERWGDRVQMKTDQNQKAEYENTKTGRMISTSVTGRATGKGGNRIVIDDPQNPKEAASEAERQSAIDFYIGTLSTRIDDRKKGAIVLIMQRLHEQDLAGYIMRTEKDWTQLVLPMRAPERTHIVFPRSPRTVVREEGDLLCPERYGEKEDADAKNLMGSYLYAGQMQQTPVPMGGGIFRQEYIRYYGGYACPPLPNHFSMKVQAWDLAFKATKTSDRVAGSVWGMNGPNFYLLDGISDQMGVMDSMKAIKVFAARHRDCGAILIEDAANGPAVCEILRQQLPGVLLVPTGGGKEARAYACQSYWESGNVWLPHPSICPWIGQWIDSITHFPRWMYDDEVDSMTHALVYLGVRGRSVMGEGDYVGNSRPIFAGILTKIL